MVYEYYYHVTHLQALKISVDAVAAPGFKKWGGKKGATIDYGGANMCA